MLLPHNIPIYEKLKETLAKNKDAIIITATGTGKSYLVAEYINEFNLNALVVCPRRSLCTYWSNLSQNVSTMTYQYFEKYIDDLMHIGKIDEFFDIFIFDEAHHTGAKCWGDAIKMFKEISNKPIIGLTADPTRYTDNGKDISIDIWEGSIVRGYSLDNSIGSILPNISYVCALYDTTGIIDDIPNGVSETLISQLKYSIENTKSCIEILQSEIDINIPHKGIVFVDRINNVMNGINIIRQTFPNEKVWAIHSKQSEKFNTKCIKEFNNSESGYIIAVDMLNEGVHVNAVDVIIMLRKTTSPTLFFQQLGRGLSVNGKTLQIFDFVSNHISLKISSNIYRDINTSFNDKVSDHYRSDQYIIKNYSKDIIDILNNIKKSLSNMWSEEEDNIIKQYYPIEGPKVADRLPGRTREACKARAYLLNSTIRHNIRWSEIEDDIIRKYYYVEGSSVSKRLPGRTRAACMERAALLNVHYNTHWTPEEDNILKEHYPYEGINVNKRLPGRTENACRYRANMLKIRKKKKKL